MTIGSFTLIRNEINFIKAHIEAWMPFLDSMIFYDGNSTDGTLEVLEGYAKHGGGLRLFKGKDPKDLTDDYTRLSNECMHSCPSDLVMFLHPDMFPENGEALRKIPSDIIAATFNIRSFAGDPDGKLYEIKGRGVKWKDIYRLNNPNLGAHYFGHYGAQDEDVYFSEITGNEHKHHGQEFSKYSYPVHESELIINHFSDVRPYARRLERMERCLINQGYTPQKAKSIAPMHPRVSLKDDMVFKFIETNKIPWLVKIGGNK